MNSAAKNPDAPRTSPPKAAPDWLSISERARLRQTKTFMYLLWMRHRLGYESTDAEQAIFLLRGAFDPAERIADDALFRQMVSCCVLAGYVRMQGNILLDPLAAIRLSPNPKYLPQSGVEND